MIGHLHTNQELPGTAREFRVELKEAVAALSPSSTRPSLSSALVPGGAPPALWDRPGTQLSRHGSLQALVRSQTTSRSVGCLHLLDRSSSSPRLTPGIRRVGGRRAIRCGGGQAPPRRSHSDGSQHRQICRRVSGVTRGLLSHQPRHL